MIELRDLSKSFVTAEGPLDALRHVSLTIQDGDIYGIIGMSGAGKSTLVRCINLLEKPTDGAVLLDGADLSAMSKKEIREVRHRISMIFQSFNLLMQRTCLQNVMLPLSFSKTKRSLRRDIAYKALCRVGLEKRVDFLPSQLSGGQKQRVAVARALVNNPDIILADEPTGALDQKSGKTVMELFEQLNNEGVTIVIITHDQNVGARAKKLLHIVDGEILEHKKEAAHEEA